MGVGAGGRLGLGALRLLNKKPLPYRPEVQPLEIEIPGYQRQPVPEEEEEEQYPALQKAARESTVMPELSKFIEGMTFPTAEQNPLSIWNMGASRGSIWGGPATVGVGLPLSGLGMFGSYALVDKILDARRKAEQEDELDVAKQRFKETVEQQYKNAAAEDLFDELAEGVEKRADDKGWYNPTGWSPSEWPSQMYEGARTGVGAVGGPYMAYAILSALAAGKLSHDFFKSRSDTKLTEEAVKRRAATRPTRPAFVYAGGPLYEDEE
jgi:hypothetical protein